MEIKKIFKLSTLKEELKCPGRNNFKYFNYFFIPATIGIISLCTLNTIESTTAMGYTANNNAYLQENFQLFKNRISNTNSRQTTMKLSILGTAFREAKKKKRKRFSIINRHNENRERLSLKTFGTTRLREQNKLRTIREVQQNIGNANLRDDILSPKSNPFEVQPTKQTVMQWSSSRQSLDNFLAPAIKCQDYKDNCSLYCSDGSVSYIDESLDQLQAKCRNIDLNLTVAKCEFYNGIFQQSFFYGSFSLGALNINECNLQMIKANAFKHNNVKNLHTLIITNNQLATLSSSAFDGLTNLLNFEFVQNTLSVLFQGEAFLTPLAKMLEKAIVQPSRNSSAVMDPLNWWQQLQMISLTMLDIGNTNLQDVLNSKTFQPFAHLEYLMLNNCNLYSIMEDVFDFISPSFKYLDISSNHLHTLNYEFLLKLGAPNIELNLSLNEWNCECGEEMLQYFTYNDVKLSHDILCSAPEKWQHFELVQVIVQCEKKESTIVTITDSSTSPATSLTPEESSIISITNGTSTSVVIDSSSYSTAATPETSSMRYNISSTTRESSTRSTTAATSTSLGEEPNVTNTAITHENSSVSSTVLSTQKSSISTSTLASESSPYKTTTTEETSSVSSKVSPTLSSTSESTSTSPAKTPILNTTTIRQQSSSVSPSTANPIAENRIPLQCYSNAQKTETLWRFVTKPKTSFSLHANSSTSLTIAVQLDEVINEISIIYKTEHDGYQYYDHNCSCDHLNDADIQEIIYIQDLLPSEPYMYCVLTESSWAVSPFDCKSYTINFKSLRTQWLLESDKVWFLSVNCSVGVLLFLASLLLVYTLLRFNPQCLNNGIRCEKIVMFTKTSYRTSQSQQPSSLSLRSSHYLSALPISADARNRDIENITYDSKHVAPCLRAPILPPTAEICQITGHPFCINSERVCSENTDYMDALGNDTENIIYDSQHAVPGARAPIMPPIAKVSQITGHAFCIHSEKSCSKNTDYLDALKNDIENIIYDSNHEVLGARAPILPPTTKNSKIVGHPFCTHSEKDCSENTDYLDALKNDTENIIYDSQHAVPGLRAPILPPIAKISQRTGHPFCMNSEEVYTENADYLNALENYTENVIYSSQHAVPDQSAPQPPTAVDICGISHNSACSSGTKTIASKKNYSQNTDYLDVIENDPDYQTIDHYEAIYF